MIVTDKQFLVLMTILRESINHNKFAGFNKSELITLYNELINQQNDTPNPSYMTLDMIKDKVDQYIENMDPDEVVERFNKYVSKENKTG